MALAALDLLKGVRSPPGGQDSDKESSPPVPVEIKGEDGLIQQPLLHHDIQRGWNTIHGQSGKAKAKYPIEGGKSKDQTGLPQSLPKSHGYVVDSPDLGVD